MTAECPNWTSSGNDRSEELDRNSWLTATGRLRSSTVVRQRSKFAGTCNFPSFYLFEGMGTFSQSLHEKYELNLQLILNRSVLDEVVNLSPREVKTRLEAGIAIAAAEDKRELDLTSWRLTACESLVKKNRMGYL